jgi:hypothetical protein
MGKSIQNNQAPTKAGACIVLDEFPAGYSWMGCSPALPISASPASSSFFQLWAKSGDASTGRNKNDCKGCHGTLCKGCSGTKNYDRAFSVNSRTDARS